MGEQNNENTKKLRNIICVCYIERTSVGNTECSSFFFTPSSARVGPLVIVLSDSLWKRIVKWETSQILKEDRSLVGV
jgi:hypothetical protein